MKQMYDNLKALTQKNDMFFSSIQTTPNGTPVEIFSYHVASYSDWLEPDAMECRGIMFDISDKQNPVIVCRPFPKFFNLNENPLSEADDVLPHVVRLEEKRDGSLISTYLDDSPNGKQLLVKSKGSLYSDQANDANRFLQRPENAEFKQTLKVLAEHDYTVSMEYTAPKNQIVLKYDEQALIILCIRHNQTGEYLEPDDIPEFDQTIEDFNVLPEIQRTYVDYEDGFTGITEEAVEAIREMKGIEGYVLVGENQRVKLKTDWYVNLHRLKDNINNDKRLVESVVEERTDDLRQLFEHDSGSVQKIADFENRYIDLIGKYIHEIRELCQSLEGKDRKTYAITAQQKVSWQPLFGVVMKQFDGYSEDSVYKGLKQVVMKNVEHFIPKEYK